MFELNGSQNTVKPSSNKSLKETLQTDKSLPLAVVDRASNHDHSPRLAPVLTHSKVTKQSSCPSSWPSQPISPSPDRDVADMLMSSVMMTTAIRPVQACDSELFLQVAEQTVNMRSQCVVVLTNRNPRTHPRRRSTLKRSTSCHFWMTNALENCAAHLRIFLCRTRASQTC